MTAPHQTPQTSPDSDALAIELWTRVTHGFHSTSRRVHATVKAEFDLSEAETDTLLSLLHCPSHRERHNALATGAGFSSGGFTKVADKLTERGVTQRASCDSDRRVIYLELTAPGLELATRLAAAVAELHRTHFIEVLGHEQAELVAAAMTTLHEANRGH